MTSRVQYPMLQLRAYAIASRGKPLLQVPPSPVRTSHQTLPDELQHYLYRCTMPDHAPVYGLSPQWVRA